MDNTNFSTVFDRIMSLNNLQITPDVREKLCVFTEFLLTENEKYNLTAIKTPDEVIAKHYTDSFFLSDFIKSGLKVIDIGSGAGFPAIPLALLRPDLSVYALEASTKKCGFIEKSANLIGLDNLHVLNFRAEDAARNNLYREKFDYATARAVATLRILSELALPFVNTGGTFAAMKGEFSRTNDEMAEAQAIITTLGGSKPIISDLHRELVLPDETRDERSFVLINKKHSTPSTYPRSYANILNNKH